MPCLLLQFIGRRYHATPWGHHVNEGLVEWPPSPWRLCRALLATGYTKLGWREDALPTALDDLLAALAASPPTYHLPPAVTAHTRHYMPIPGNTTKVLDTFAHVGDAAMAIAWDAALSPEAYRLFAELARHLSYLGRAESWVEATATPSAEPRGNSYLATLHDGQPRGPGWEQVSLLAPLPAPDYATWRQAAVTRDREAARAAGKTTKKALEGIDALYPKNLAACLGVGTPWLQKHGWSQPPGSRRLLYWRPTATLEPPRPRARAARPRVSPQTFALLALASNAARGEVLPSLYRALPQAEILHAALVAEAARGEAPLPCPVFIGRDEDGQPLKGHPHAHLLPLSLSGGRQLDHVLVYAPMGLDGNAQAILGRLRRTYSKKLGELFVTLAGFGSAEGFLRGHAASAAGRGRWENPFAVLDRSRVWQSLTPFVPPRFPKKNRHTVAEQVNAELVARGFPPATVSFLPKEEFVAAGLHRFVRVRGDAERRPPVDCAFGVRLEFAEEQAGPVSLGYASHFGLGLFRPAPPPLTR